jgi:hypothetical protein
MKGVRRNAGRSRISDLDLARREIRISAEVTRGRSFFCFAAASFTSCRVLALLLHDCVTSRAWEHGVGLQPV